MTLMKPGIRRDGPAGPPAARAIPDVIESPPRRRVLNLFKEAWRRRRRRRAAAVAAVVLAAAAAIAVWGTWWPGTAAPRRAEPAARARAGLPDSPGQVALPSVAWVDYNGQLHLGDLATGRQRVLATVSNADAAPAYTPLVSAGGRLFWVDTHGAYLRGYGYWPDIVRSLDLATGVIRDIAPGQEVFASADGRHVFIAWTGTDLIEAPASGSGPSRQLTVPRGWFIPGNGGVGGANAAAVGVGILVQASDYQNNPHPTRLGIWKPQTGKVKVLGRMASADYGLVGAVTLPGAPTGFVAWVPSPCGRVAPWHCVRITDTATMSAVTVRSPPRWGFALGGAFSANGRWLAVFASSGLVARLAIVNTRTGVLRLVPGVSLGIGEDIAWAQPVPGRSEFIAGALAGAYLIDPARLSARPFHFMSDDGLGIQTSQDVNYSAAVVSAGGR